LISQIPAGEYQFLTNGCQLHTIQTLVYNLIELTLKVSVMHNIFQSLFF